MTLLKNLILSIRFFMLGILRNRNNDPEECFILTNPRFHFDASMKYTSRHVREIFDKIALNLRVALFSMVASSCTLNKKEWDAKTANNEQIKRTKIGAMGLPKIMAAMTPKVGSTAQNAIISF
jgi:hypothetical protein